ncbi:TPA: phage tail protein [Yersinia enterocolitica]|nr:phage tail protein [Yersinia enterocolitica]HDL7834221.1 phage tail protein [Yersinia enterocolitica]HDL7875073.1 phage tail protein [Yersinia enterocolitica]HDL7887651.1 phage tail protein [Yersinia enterocolitica]HDL7896252.1 phage tail protein [Yersinia enterocolitica]
MAESDLNTPVTISNTRIDASILPSNFSQSYFLYVIQQNSDLSNVAGKANEAGQGAYDAQQQNEQQDVILANHETRITANALAIYGLTVRVIDAESAITSIQTNVATLTTRVTTVEGIVATIQGDYLSKSASTDQIIQPLGGSLIVGTIATPTTDKIQSSDSVNALVSYKVAGLKVIGPRETGWTASTGTALKSAFNANLAFPTGTTYSQSEMTALANGLIAARQRIKALEDAMRTHGLIN